MNKEQLKQIPQYKVQYTEEMNDKFIKKLQDRKNNDTGERLTHEQAWGDNA